MQKFTIFAWILRNIYFYPSVDRWMNDHPLPSEFSDDFPELEEVPIHSGIDNASRHSDAEVTARLLNTYVGMMVFLAQVMNTLAL